jgi:hypothetical protein
MAETQACQIAEARDHAASLRLLQELMQSHLPITTDPSDVAMSVYSSRPPRRLVTIKLTLKDHP